MACLFRLCGSWERIDIIFLAFQDMTPLVLNADVISVSASPPNVSAEILLSQHSRLRNCRIPPVISLGWCPPSGSEVRLSSRQIAEMSALARNRSATLAMRADVALASEQGLKELLSGLPGCGVTLWAHPSNAICPEALKDIVERLGTVPVWVDVPELM